MSIDLAGYVPKKTVIELGNRKFTFTELSLRDMAEFKAALVKKREILNAERRERLLELADKIKGIDPLELLKLTDSSISSDELEAQMISIEGMGHLAYLSLRYAHQGISLEQAAEIVTLGVVDEVVAAMLPIEKIEEIKKKVAQTKEESQSQQQ